MKKTISYFLFICGLLMAAVTSCKDDLLYTDGGLIPEGESIVTAQVDFKPLVESLTDKSRTAGDAIKSINDLCVLLYNVDGILVEARSLTCVQGSPADGEYSIDEITRKKEDAADPNENIAENKTPRANLSLKIPYGRYYIYAVANMGKDFNEAVEKYGKEDDTDNTSEEVEKYKTAIGTVKKLKNISFTWQTNDVTKNSQMFGHFTVIDQEDKGELLTVNKKAMKLHAWIRRAASKVTIAYDGSGLKEGVFIYLKSVTIKDIPKSCYLGQDNPAAPENYQPTDGDGGVKLDLIPEGETIKYYEGDTEPDLVDFKDTYEARVTKGMPFLGSGYNTLTSPSETKTYYHPEKLEDVHTEFTNALYFYENMQGKGEEGTPSDKRQVVAGANDKTKPTYPEGGMKDDKAWKDAKPYGTYIEVDAFYVSINKEKVGRGPIKYRFMLGKDVVTDYNAERNHHYKLTLKFKGYANDADWHIEYEEPEPGIEIPNPYYISYLYNRTMNLPVKINTGGGTLESLSARIIYNNWAPYGTLPVNAGGLAYAREYDYAETPDKSNDQPWHGFLSLRKTSKRILLGEHDDVLGEKDMTDNKDYYESTQRGERVYIPAESGVTQSDGTYESQKDGHYEISKVNDNQLLASIPLYTRAKQMYIKSGYTGNNPYVAYQRHARVEIMAKINLGAGNIFSKKDTVDIFQVRRIVNPKGIYRSNGNNKTFHVTLLRLPRENAETFESFSSEGPWKAYVVNEKTELREGDPVFTDPNPGFITLGIASKNTKLDADGVIYGETGSDIKFDILFHGSGDSNKNAVIRVEYHNYTCEHLIFVHQGDKPQELLSGQPKWHISNLISKGQEASNPLDEGSLFKFGNLDQVIAAKNQYNAKRPMINVEPGDFPDPITREGLGFELVGSTDKAVWRDIKNKPANTVEPWNGFEVLNARIATLDDYQALFDSPDIAQGYGVLYGDEADKPAINLLQAYGYQENNKYGKPADPKDKLGCGMRGCFVYNRTNGRSVFFPIGASGYGHRKEKEQGCLRYSSGQKEIFGVSISSSDKFYGSNPISKAPLFYDLYMRPGAVYWIKEAVGSGGVWGTNVGWDINYFTFDFNKITQANVFNGNNSDACFIRCVEDPN